jgi:hypothetical protein
MKGNKSYLPQKICAACKKPFSWRKKWEKNWAEVKFCSRACGSKGNKLSSILA